MLSDLPNTLRVRLSLVLNRDDFFKTGPGIYPKGEGVEKAVSMELIYPETGDGLQGDGSVQIVGGSMKMPVRMN